MLKQKRNKLSFFRLGKQRATLWSIFIGALGPSQGGKSDFGFRLRSSNKACSDGFLSFGITGKRNASRLGRLGSRGLRFGICLRRDVVDNAFDDDTPNDRLFLEHELGLDGV